MGDIETGVRQTLEALGITEPKTGLEMLAIQLARTLDSEPEKNTIAALSRELRLTLEQCARQPAPQGDRLDALISRQ
jgi:hypothetical protein